MIEDTCTEDTTCGLAKKEFKVIRDLLLVPLKQDLQNEEISEHRKWKGGCIRAGMPDLVPINTNPGEGVLGFCKLDGNKLVVTVENQGKATAPESTTRVTFVNIRSFKVESFDERTSKIPAGERAEVRFGMPEICSGSDNRCLFIITVNAKFDVIESNLTNNIAIGMCGRFEGIESDLTNNVTTGLSDPGKIDT